MRKLRLRKLLSVMVVEPGLQVQGLLHCLPTACTMPWRVPAYGAHTLGIPEARTASNQIAFLPTGLMLLRKWKFESVGWGERLVEGVLCLGYWGTWMGMGWLGEHTRTIVVLASGPGGC